MVVLLAGVMRAFAGVNSGRAVSERSGGHGCLLEFYARPTINHNFSIGA
jgi:hypothetical protein